MSGDKERKKTFCEKFESFIYKTCTVFMFVSTGGLGIGYLLLHQNKYLMNTQLIQLFFVLTGSFFIAYSINACTVFYKYRARQRICSKSNCMFGVMSLIYLWLFIYIKNFVYTQQNLIVDQFSQDCDEVYDNLNSGGTLSEPEDLLLFDQLVLAQRDADQLLCSEECPCRQPPHIDQSDFEQQLDQEDEQDQYTAEETENNSQIDNKNTDNTDSSQSDQNVEDSKSSDDDDLSNQDQKDNITNGDETKTDEEDQTNNNEEQEEPEINDNHDDSTTIQNEDPDNTQDNSLLGGDRLRQLGRGYTDEYGAVNVMNCPEFETKFNSIPLYDVIAQYLQTIQEDKLCAGICEPSQYFKFSNINNGAPIDSCKNHILDKIGEDMDYLSNMFSALVMIISVTLCLYIVILLYRVKKFCCKKKESKEEKKDRRRDYMPQGQRVSSIEETEHQFDQSRNKKNKYKS